MKPLGPDDCRFCDEYERLMRGPTEEELEAGIGAGDDGDRQAGGESAFVAPAHASVDSSPSQSVGEDARKLSPERRDATFEPKTCQSVGEDGLGPEDRIKLLARDERIAADRAVPYSGAANIAYARAAAYSEAAQIVAASPHPAEEKLEELLDAAEAVRSAYTQAAEHQPMADLFKLARHLRESGNG